VRARRGFTLIEMMVAVALMAMVLSMVGGILLSVINTREKVQDSLDSDKAGYGLLATIRRDLTGVYAYALGGPAFRGTNEEEDGRPADRIDFVTTADVADSSDGIKPRLVEVGYRIQRETEGQRLILYRRASGFEGDPLKGGGSYTGLYVGVHSLDIQYFDDEDKDWKEEWAHAKRLPVAVKIVLELSPKEVERIAAQAEGRELAVSRYEMIVGIPSQAEPEEEPDEEGEGDSGAPAPGATGAGG
jgi:general secretion pathway protein J